MVKREWRYQWKKAGLTALFAVSTVGVPASSAVAAVSDFDDFASARELRDSELGQLRGRFAGKGQIMYFGVQMTSEWRTPHGEHLLVEGNLRGDLTGRAPAVTFEPRITAVPADSIREDALAGNGATVFDSGTGNARGVVQTIQVGGDFNAVANDMQIDMLDASGRSLAIGASSLDSLERNLPSGTRVSVGQSAQGLGMAIEVPGMGSARQSIVPQQGLRQSIQLTGDLQQVRNMTRLQVYMGPGGMGTGATGMRSAIESGRQLLR